MKPKLTLDQAWEKCLKMWRWVVEQKDLGRDQNVRALKEEYVHSIGLTPYNHVAVDEGDGSDMDNVLVADCFFCEYNEQHDGSGENEDENVWDEDLHDWVQTGHCDQCPGTLVDEYFYCNQRQYNYYDAPRMFLAQIEALDVTRLRRSK